MYQKQIVLNNFDSKNKEKELFSKLSNMITIFKQMITGMQNSVIYLYKYENKLLEDQLQTIQEKATQFLEIVKVGHYGNEGFDSPKNDKTYQRFISRLIEALTPLKQKASESSILISLLLYLREIENNLNKLSIFSSFPEMTEAIHKIMLAFCFDMRSRDQESSLPSLGKIMRMTSLNVAEKQTRTQRLTTQQSEAEKKMKNAIRHINIFFKNIKCLDVDYSYFRSCFFQLKNNQDVFSEYMGRNKDIQANIKLYSKSFKEYTNRKEKKRNDRMNMLYRNKYTETSQAKSKNYSIKNNTLSKKKSFDFNSSSVTKKLNWTQDTSYNIQLNNKQKVQKNKNSADENNKTIYQMKNILITASRIKLASGKRDLAQRKNQKEVQFRTNLRQENRLLIKNLKEIIKN